MRAFGLKHTARELALQNQLPLLPGTGLLEDLDDACRQARHIGYPVMLKSTAGGGGIGMRLCWNRDELSGAYEAVKHLAQNNFKDAGLFLEKFVENARHIEVQIFGDGRGGVIALGERDCSMQRRNQKVVEETPAPNLAPHIRQALLDAAVRLGKSVNYQSAGTVEYIFDASTGEFYFLEVNTRLQVEHGVTEEVTGIDLVEWMVRQAEGDLPPLESFNVEQRGASIQVRVYAENPARDFQPSCGTLTAAQFPSSAEARIETWVERGVEITPFYDPMLAKIIVHAADREQAIARLLAALDATALRGIETNLDYLEQILQSAAFRSGRHTTSFLNGFHYLPILSMYSAPACKPPCRIIPDESATGASVCRRPGRWIAWLSVSPIVWWVTPRTRPGSRLRWRARHCASIAIASSQYAVHPWTCAWTVNR